RTMLSDVKKIYTVYNKTFPATPLTADYLALYDKTIQFVNDQPADQTLFDHFAFIRDHVNPLFAMNQKLINSYRAYTHSFNDYTLNNSSTSIFDKSLYTPQNIKGIYSLVDDTASLAEIRHI